MYEKKYTSLKKNLTQLIMHKSEDFPIPLLSLTRAVKFLQSTEEVGMGEVALLRKGCTYLPLGFLPFLDCFPTTLTFRRHALLMLLLASNTLITGLPSSTPPIVQAPTDTVELISFLISNYPQFKQGF